jgi:CubicO group peptidase (beta-lactamase class C family)
MVFPGESWAKATPASQGVSETGLDEVLAYLAVAFEDYGGVGTVFIVRNGYVIHAGPESDKEHQIYSATKPFVSTVFGLLIEDGRVSLDTPARELEPALAEHYPGVSLRHFATRTSGYG